MQENEEVKPLPKQARKLAITRDGRMALYTTQELLEDIGEDRSPNHPVIRKALSLARDEINSLTNWNLLIPGEEEE